MRDIDYDSVVQAVSDQRSLASARASAFMDDSPDDAAEAHRISQATGVPPVAVNADLPAFQQQYKSNLAQDIVRNNPIIANYVQSHPLAAQISNDDYGNLDEASHSLTTLQRAHQVISAPFASMFDAAKAVGQSYQSVFEHSGEHLSDEEIKDHRLRSSLAASLDTAVDLGK